MDRWLGRVALVTGASAGMGAAIAKQLVQHGLIVVACARNITNIQQMSEELKSAGAKGQLHAQVCDLRKEDNIVSLFAWIKEHLGGVDVCINNAGVSDYLNKLLTGSEETMVANWRNMMDVNVLALCLCTKLAVASMRERGVNDGQIIHIGSTLGHMSAPNVNHFYSCTKHAVRALTEGHRQELRELKSQIRVAAISPGLTETEFALRSSGDPARAKAMYSSMKCLQAQDVADAVVYVLGAPNYVQVHDILMRPLEQVY